MQVDGFLPTAYPNNPASGSCKQRNPNPVTTIAMMPMIVYQPGSSIAKVGKAVKNVSVELMPVECVSRLYYSDGQSE